MDDEQRIYTVRHPEAGEYMAWVDCHSEGSGGYFTKINVWHGSDLLNTWIGFDLYRLLNPTFIGEVELVIRRMVTEIICGGRENEDDLLFFKTCQALELTERTI